MPVTGSLESAVEDAAVTRCRRQLAQQLRVDSVRASATVRLGHPMSSMSAAELMAVLLDGHLRLDFFYPRENSWHAHARTGARFRSPPIRGSLDR